MFKLILFFMLFIGCTTSTTKLSLSADISQVQVVPYSDTDFIKAQGSKLVTANGKEYFIKGMAFGNQVWNNVKTAPQFHHTKESYAEIAQMGFNTVRFYINYQLFEDDSKPGKYKNEGFQWLNKNIEWAKEAGIKLIVNMHVPQGGFQSNGNGLTLFTHKENQERLINLWREIARYYKDCSTIIGWGLVNEPCVPFNTNTTASLKAWDSLANEITVAIRQVDSNHIIFVECAIAVIEIKNGIKTYHSFSQEDSFPIIQDDNIVYEFHSYNPMEFTHQGASWIENLKNVETVYPDNDYVSINYKEWLCEKQTKFHNTEKGFSQDWAEYTYMLSNWSDTQATVFNATVKPSLLGLKGEIYIDDVKISLIDKMGSAKVLYNYTFDTTNEWAFGSGDGSGKIQYITTDGHENNGCLKVQGCKSWAWLSAPEQIPLEEGCVYEIKYWIKTKNIPAVSYASFGVDLSLADIDIGIDKTDLEQAINHTIKSSVLKSKPVFVGEFGCIRNCFTKDLGAAQYIKDSIDIFSSRTCGYNYHTYHEYSFGLHSSDPAMEYPSKNDLNTELRDLFIHIQIE